MGSSRPSNSTRPRKAHSSTSRTRRKPHYSPEALAARLAKRKAITSLGPAAAVNAPREGRDGVRASALREIRRKLNVASAVAYVCATALRGQAADDDIDVALCLQRCIGDTLSDQMRHIDRLLGEDGGENGGAL